MHATNTFSTPLLASCQRLGGNPPPCGPATRRISATHAASSRFHIAVASSGFFAVDQLLPWSSRCIKRQIQHVKDPRVHQSRPPHPPPRMQIESQSRSQQHNNQTCTMSFFFFFSFSISIIFTIRILEKPSFSTYTPCCIHNTWTRADAFKSTSHLV